MTDNLAWIDIETTGLEVGQSRILEIGIAVTSRAPSFTLIAQRNWVLPFDGHLVHVHDIPEVVIDMHRKSHLWEECHLAWLATSHQPKNMWSTVDERDDEMCSFLKEHDADGSPMCGSSVHFDRGFLNWTYPHLSRMFHYRNFDVSTLSQLAGMIDPNWESASRDLHRALPDLEDSIATARKFVQRYFSTHPTLFKDERI